MNIPDLFVVTKVGADDAVFWGSYGECRTAMLRIADTTSMRSATQADVNAKIADLTEQYDALNFYYQNSAWESGPRYRAQLDQLQKRIAHFRSFLSAGPSQPVEQTPAAELASPLTDAAGAPMTLAEAEAVIRRPETDDATLLSACAVIERHSTEASIRATAERIVQAISDKMLEVE